jgi:hypothetical protein
MSKEERQRRLNELLEIQRQKQNINMVNELYELLQDVFHDTKGFEILDENLSNIVNKQFCEIFPITLWNRIYWEVSTVNQMELNEEDISQIPSILESLACQRATRKMLPKKHLFVNIF